MVKVMFSARLLLLAVLLIGYTQIMGQKDTEKPRVIVLTDIENEPDDAMSLVRFLTYSNQWDVEGLVATTSIHQKNKTAAWRIREILAAYAKVRENLLQHEPGYPTADHLQSVVKEGRKDYGMNAVGEGMDSPGSEGIIAAVDRDDQRPVWVLVWGGPNCLAQALWKVQNTRSPEEVIKFVSKLRVYTISDQDDSGPWIRKTFPYLFYIASPGFHPFGGYHNSTWTGISGDRFHGRFAGGNFSIVDNPWLDKHVRSKGPLGAEYPQTTFIMEGDSPSFLFLINNGLGNPEHPDWGSWGGRYEFYQPRTEKWFFQAETRPLWNNAQDEVLGADNNWHTSNKATIWRWRTAYQNDFAARMDWTIKSYKDANHPPLAKLNHDAQLAAKVGDRIELSAEGSTDPDGDPLTYKWFYYAEPGSFTISSGRTGAPLKIENADQANAWFTVPKTQRAGTLHIILAVTDQGELPLTRYKRVIINVSPDEKVGQASNYLDLNWKKVATQMPAAWYGSAEAKLVAENILLSQKDIGGWAKNKPYHHLFSTAEKADFVRKKAEWGATFDNDATIAELRFLAKVHSHLDDARYQQAFEKGLNYILISQYENGGWPQFYPVRKGKSVSYSSHITYNDDAMVNVMLLLKDIINNDEAFSSLQISSKTKVEAQKAFDKGIQCILSTQIRVNGEPTVWCAQHDEKTLAPAKARKYELESFSGSESVDVALLLMQIDHPSKEVLAAVDGAVKWFENHKIEGIRLEKEMDGDGKENRIVVEDKNALPLWGRFYDLETGKPFFCDRDGIKKSSMAEIGHERRNGYSWYTGAPAKLLKKYPKWKKEVSLK